jgi:hypothetical protein
MPLGEKTPQWAGGGGISAVGDAGAGEAGLETPVAGNMNSTLGRKNGRKSDKSDVTLTFRDQEKVRWFLFLITLVG